MSPTDSRWRRPRTLATLALLATTVGALVAAAVPAEATPITSPGGGESFDLHPGDSFRVGYDFSIPGNSQAVTVTWTDPKAVVNYTCPDGTPGSFTIAMPDYTVTVSNGDWYPSGDQHSDLVYQGSTTVPDACGGGGILHQNHIATFTADVTSNPGGVNLHYRFHDADNNASGSWSSTESVTTSTTPPPTQTIQGEIYACVNGAPSTTLVSGGTIAVPAASLSSANPLPATQVPAGTYTMNATAPAGQQFVACGQSGVTIPSPGSASQSVQVPAGGSGDGRFYVTAAPTGSGYLEVCKSAANSVTGNFGFFISALHRTISVPAGACSHPIKVPAGVVLVEEAARANYEFVSVSASPADRVVNIDPSRRNISVRVVQGGVAKEVIVTFVNRHATGTVKICQIAGSGVAVGTSFGFTSTATNGVTTVPAGHAPGGTCAVLGTVWQGGTVTITQQIPSGDSVSAIHVRPAARLVGSADLAQGKVSVHVGTGVTEVAYTDTRP